MLMSEQHTSILRGSDAKVAAGHSARLPVIITLHVVSFPLCVDVKLSTDCIDHVFLLDITTSYKSCFALQGGRTPGCQRPCRAQRRVVASAATVEAPAEASQVGYPQVSPLVPDTLQAGEASGAGTLTLTNLHMQTRTGGEEPLLLRALNGEKVERPPVWMMRQAGRYMKVGGFLRSVLLAGAATPLTHTCGTCSLLIVQPSLQFQNCYKAEMSLFLDF